MLVSSNLYHPSQQIYFALQCSLVYTTVVRRPGTAKCNVSNTGLFGNCTGLDCSSKSGNERGLEEIWRETFYRASCDRTAVMVLNEKRVEFD